MRLDIPAIKMGPGDSKRSHSADEFITLKELYDAIEIYIKYIKELTL
jgi:acetylornithine deacetylase